MFVYEIEFLQALLLTSVIEVPVVVLLVKNYYKRGSQWKKAFFVALIASVLTLPYLWFVLPAFVSQNFYVVTGELTVFAIEMMMYKVLLELRWSRSFILSFCANFASFMIGVLF